MLVHRAAGVTVRFRRNLLDLDPMISKSPSGTPARRQPDTSEAALQWAANAMQSGRAAEAERAAGEVLQKNPGDARAAHIYGHALYQQGRGQDAIAPLERAIQQNHSPILETQLGMLLRQADRPDDALKYFARATKRQPPFPPAFLEYGSLLLEKLRYDEAVETLNAVFPWHRILRKFQLISVRPTPRVASETKRATPLLAP